MAVTDETGSALDRLEAAIRASGLLSAGETVIALVSGGPDSACLVAGLSGFLDPGNLVALHVNYGLRPESDADAAVASRLCEGLGVDLVTISAEGGTRDGNVLDWARRVRYEAAEELRAESGADRIAAGHTATDVAETLIYRLASSPGARALPGMQPQFGHVVRPLLGLERAETRSIATACGLEFTNDASNLDPKFARSRIRGEVLPVLEQINPAAVKNILATQAELSEEQALLDRLAAETVNLARAGETSISAEMLAESPPVLRRLGLRSFAESVLGRSVPVSSAKSATVWKLAARGEGGRVDLGGGASFLVEAGLIRVVTGDGEAPEPEPAKLTVPGACEWGAWTVRAEILDEGFELLGPEVATLDAAEAGDRLTVRGWREGDRIEPLGMEGSKSLQDLFTDRAVPRSLRHGIPVVLSGEEIAWVAGVAIGRRFRVRESTGAAIRLSAVQSPHRPISA